MRSIGIFTIHEFRIKYDKVNEPIYLIPFGDIHRYSPMHAEERWLETIEWAKKKPRCYFLGMGDYFDVVSASERKSFKSSDLHDSTEQTLNEYFRSLTLKFVKEISFMKDRLIGMVEGNHYWTYPSDITTTQEMCNLLKCKYLGTSSLIRLGFDSSHRGGSNVLDVIVHHGRGASRVAGGDMRAVEQLADMAECDIALMGDNHKKGVDFKEKLYLTAGRPCPTLHHRKILLARTGSFLKGWEVDQKSYVVDQAYNPTDLGLVKIELTPRRSRDSKDSTWIDIHASI